MRSHLSVGVSIVIKITEPVNIKNILYIKWEFSRGALQKFHVKNTLYVMLISFKREGKWYFI